MLKMVLNYSKHPIFTACTFKIYFIPISPLPQYTTASTSSRSDKTAQWGMVSDMAECSCNPSGRHSTPRATSTSSVFNFICLGTSVMMEIIMTWDSPDATTLDGITARTPRDSKSICPPADVRGTTRSGIPSDRKEDKWNAF